MWIPTPIYERVPQFWLLLGLLFMSSGIYLGFDYALSFLYFAVGFVCSAWSMWIFSMRALARQDSGARALVPHPADAKAQARPAEQAEQQQYEILNRGAETPT